MMNTYPITSPKRMISAPILLAFIFLVHAILPSYAANQETILIVDGSGSMWGKFDKEHKIVTVRDLLPKNLEKYEGKGNLGLISYGHRWKSNCRDIELLVPVSKVRSAAHGQKLSKLSARGKTPITGALRLAQSSFSPEARVKQIILLADGTENCRVDPCAFTKEMVAKDKTITAHVITYGMGKKDAKTLQCISTLTKGQFLSPQNRTELDQTLKTLLAKNLLLQRRTLVKNKKPKSELKAKPGLVLKAYLGNSKIQLKDKVKWLVYKTADDAKNNIAPISMSEKPDPVFTLDSGSYFVLLVNGKMGSGKVISVDKNARQEIVFRLNAGILSVSFEANQAFLSAVKDFRISLLSGQKGGSSIPILFTSENKDIFTLPAGQYKLVTQLKNHRDEQVVSLKAGEHKKIGLPVSAGLLSLKAVQSYEGVQLKNISYKIMQKQPNGSGQYDEFLRLASAQPNIVLPVGSYYVEAKSHLAVAIENFEITGGTHHHLSLNLNAGQVKLSSTLSSGRSLQNGEVTYKIIQSDLAAMESQTPLLETSLTNKSLQLPVGSYIISSSAGKGGSYSEQTITVEAGTTQSIDFIHKANVTTLSCRNKKGKTIKRNLFWKVTNSTGQTVTRSSLASLKLLLEEGNYTAQAFYQDKDYVTKFRISADAKPSTVVLRVN